MCVKLKFQKKQKTFRWYIFSGNGKLQGKVVHLRNLIKTSILTKLNNGWKIIFEKTCSVVFEALEFSTAEFLFTLTVLPHLLDHSVVFEFWRNIYVKPVKIQILHYGLLSGVKQ